MLTRIKMSAGFCPGIFSPGETKTMALGLSATPMANDVGGPPGSYTINYLDVLNARGTHELRCYVISEVAHGHWGKVWVTIYYDGGKMWLP